MDELDKWITQLNSDDMTMAIEAAEILGQIGGSSAQNALKTRFAPYRFMTANTEKNRLFFTIALVLAEMGSYYEYRIVVDEDAPFVRPRVTAMLECIGKWRAVKMARAVLSSNKEDERYWAAQILVALRAPKKPPLLPASDDKPSETQCLYDEAFQAYCVKAYREALDLLHNCLLLDDQHVEAQKLKEFIEKRLAKAQKRRPG
jgi:hypothetical protein